MQWKREKKNFYLVDDDCDNSEIRMKKRKK